MCRAVGNEMGYPAAYHTPEHPTAGDCHMALLNVQWQPLKGEWGE